MQATSCARPPTNVVKRARRHHTKSRDGCQTCKARKVKCDEESSGCGNCVQFGVPCDFLPLLERKRWATTTATTATRRQQVTKRRRGRPRADWSGWALRAHDEALAPSSPLSSPSSSSSSSNQLQIRLSQPVPLHTQLNLQLAELAVDDLALLHHYHTVTAPTLGDARLWRDAAPRLGREHPCIFHIMLSLSAYHLARLRPATTTSSASAAHCRRLAEHHYEAAVRLAVPMLPRLDVGNCQALYVVTVLICFTAFARGPSSSGDLLLVAQQQGLVPWMSLLRGVRFVLETVGSATVLSGFLAPVPETTPEACYACRSGCGRCFAALAQRRAWNWRETLGRIQDVAAKKTCSDAASTAATAAAKICDGAIRSLVRCFETTFREDDATMPKTCTQGQVHVVMAWAYTLDPDFVAKLAESDEISLVLLGHFAVLVQTLGRSRNAGVINYYLPVYAAGAGCDPVSGESACVPELLLWFFNSRGGKYYPTHTRQPDWVDETVVDWFMATNRQLADQYGRVVPSIAFVHIPIHAAAVLKKQGPGGHVDLQRHPSINDDKINGQSHGWPRNANANNTTRTGDRGGYTRRGVPFMQALVATPCLIGLFYGHDHGNTWCYRWTDKLDGLDVDAGVAGAGLHLCYGQHTDYGGYGYWVRGERQIVATRKGLRNGTLDTHTMLETGEVVGKVTLNSTFNDDVYDTVPNVKTFMPLSAGKELTSLAVTLRPALAVLALLLLL